MFSENVDVKVSKVEILYILEQQLSKGIMVIPTFYRTLKVK